MSDSQTVNMPSPSVEILNGLAAMLEHIRPEVVLMVGTTALSDHDTATAQEAKEIAAAAERILRNITPILQAAGVTVETVAEVPRPAPAAQVESFVEEEVIGEAEVTEIESAGTDEVAEAPHIENETVVEEQDQTIVLTELQTAILDFARTGGAFRTEELRRAIPSLANASNTDYELFKTGFADTREAITDFLTSNGASATWVEAGKARGKNYQLVIEGEVQPPTPEATVQPEQVTPQDQTQEVSVAEDVSFGSADQDVRDDTEVLRTFLEGPTGEKLSPTEKMIVRATVLHLKQFEDRQSMRTIISAVFGQSKLSRAEEARLTQILDCYVEEGLMRSYGKCYGFKTQADQNATQDSFIMHTPETDEALNSHEQDILDFIYANAPTQGGDLNIGHIVRQYFKVQRLAGPEFYNFISILNSLADRGHLVHAEGSAWYGIRRDEKTVATKPEEQPYLPSMTTRPLEQFLPDTTVSVQQPEKTTVVTKEKTAETVVKEPGNSSSSRAETVVSDYDLSSLHLSDREQLITLSLLRCVKPGEWFQQKQVDVSEIHFSSDSARRQAFTVLSRRLLEAGLLITQGEKGGKKYQLTDKISDLQQSTAAEPTPEPVVTTAPVSPVSQNGTKPVETVTEEPAAPLSPAELRLQQRDERIGLQRAAQFTIRLASAVQVSLSRRPDKTERLSVISQEVASSLGVPRETAKEMLGQLVAAEHLFYHGSQKGNRILSVDPPTEPKLKPTTGEVRESKGDQFTEEDIVVATQVFGRLLELTHVQQGLSMRTLIRQLEVPKDQEDAYRRSIRRIERAGYLAIEAGAAIVTGSPHSRRRSATIVKISSQEVKDRLKTDRYTVLAELKNLVNA